MTLAEQLATLLEQGHDQPRHRVVAAEELRRLRAEVDQLRAELTALREQKPVAYMVEYFGPNCGNQYAIYKADDMGCLRDKSQYTPLYVAPQPGATK